MFTLTEIVIFCLKYFVLLPSLLFALFHGLAKLLYIHYPYEDDSNRSIEEIISSRGFICEDHSITTLDGYILTIQRIVRPDNIFSRKYKSGSGGTHSPILSSKPPVLLQHGMFSNSRSWLVASNDGHYGIDLNRNCTPQNVVDNSLAFALAKEGYDVFLGNIRGNLYSLKHERFDYLKDPEFWNCSMSEIVRYDLPATIDYILKLTGHDTIGYVGFSQGTTSMFALMTQEDKYNHIVKPFIAMAPVANPHHTNPLKFPEQFKQKVFRFIQSWCHSHPGPVLPLVTERVARYMCCNIHFRSFFNRICFNIVALSNFPDPNRALIYSVTGGSHCMRRNLSHVLQNIENKYFCDYNYGKETNLRKYGKEDPPIFDLKKITNKFICFFYSINDIVVRFEDVIDLKKKLSIPLMYDFEVPGYNHLDFQIGQTLGATVNNRIIKIFNSTTKCTLDENENFASKTEQ